MSDFDRNVFINCPFDSDYAPILQAILFCVVYLGLVPRLATERGDGGETRLDKIRGLIEESRWSIHDLSRCQAKTAGEMYRLNMPFELGVDFGCRAYFGQGREKKRFLILEEQRFRYQAALSDISGSDIEAHNGDFEEAVYRVRNWLKQEAGIAADPPSIIVSAYVDFQAWHYRRELARGVPEKDILKYPTFEMLEAMQQWMSAGKPRNS